MYIVNEKTNAIIFEVVGGENLTLSEALELFGDRIVKQGPWDPDYIIGGREVWYEDLIYTANAEEGHTNG